MSLISGSTALTICRLSKPLPTDYLSRLAAHSICKLSDVKDTPVTGWAGYRHFEAAVDEADAICGGYLCIQLVQAERKIPAPLLQDACRKQELAYMQANDCGSTPSKERKRIKAEVIERNLMKMPPTVSTIPLAIDQKENLAYIGTASPRAVDKIVAMFFRSTEVELLPLNPEEIIKTAFIDVLGPHGELPVLQIAAGQKQEDATPGYDFLTWFWHHAEEKGGKLDSEYSGKLGITANGAFEAMVEGPLVFAFPNSEAKGAAESAVKKGGCPLASSEAKAALLSGKKLKRAKLAIVRGQEVWSGTFDADKFSFSGLSLPEGEEMERNARFEERMQKLATLAHCVMEYAKRYGSEIVMQSAGLMTTKLRAWAEQRESY